MSGHRRFVGVVLGSLSGVAMGNGLWLGGIIAGGGCVLGGCIIVDDQRDSGIDVPLPGTGTTTTGQPQADTLPNSGVGDTTASPDGDGDTGPEPECSENQLSDGGLEQGTPNPSWAEASPLFGTPICDAGCSEDPGAEPYAGDWFAWFGGAQRPDVGSLSQMFAVNADAAQLRFRFTINAAAGTGDDVFRVLVDGNTVFMRTDADIADFEDYTLIPLTLDQWADGEQHELRFESEVFGGGLTNFFVDSIALVGCGPLGPVTSDGGADTSSSSSSSDGVDSTATADGTGGTTGSSGGSTSGGSTSGGSTSGIASSSGATSAGV